MRKRQTELRRKGRIESILEHYEPRISPQRANYDILDWASPLTQEARFRALADNVELRGRSILDVGCGLGDLRSYLAGRGIDADYTGVDVSEKMVAAALQRQPGGKFLRADLFDGAGQGPGPSKNPFADGSFDVIYCSGLFNLDLGNNVAFVPQAVALFLRLARRCVVCNMLHKRAGVGDGTYFYYDPAEILPPLRKLAGEVRVIDDYLPNDFTVFCFKSAGGA
jgi:SAM-dependent methyltransferase